MAQSIFVANGQGYSDRNCQQVSICGKEMVLDPSGALFMPAARVLVISDLITDGHNRRTKLRRRKMHRMSEKMMLLDDVINRFAPEKIVALGEVPFRRDRFKDLEGAANAMFFSYFDDHEWHWVGPYPDGGLECDLDLMVHEEFDVSGLALRYKPLPGPVTHEVASGINPAAFIGAPGYAIRRPCFVSNGMRMVMPRFGSFSGGENVLSGHFERYFTGDGLSVWMLGYEGVQPVACRQLRAD